MVLLVLCGLGRWVFGMLCAFFSFFRDTISFLGKRYTRVKRFVFPLVF